MRSTFTCENKRKYNNNTLKQVIYYSRTRFDKLAFNLYKDRIPDKNYYREKINDIYDSKENILKYLGGTVCSISLKKALALLTELENDKDLPNFPKTGGY